MVDIKIKTNTTLQISITSTIPSMDWIKQSTTKGLVEIRMD